MFSKLTIRRPLSLESSFASVEEPLLFKRTYTLFQLTLFGFGNIIGTGVFTLTGPASQYAGNAVFISYMIGGLISVLTALCFAELASEVPKAGSSYLYTYCMFGEMPAWMVAWNQLFQYAISSATMARGMSPFVQMVFGKWIPDFVFEYRGTNPFSVIFLVACTILSNSGT